MIGPATWLKCQCCNDGSVAAAERMRDVTLHKHTQSVHATSSFQGAVGMCVPSHLVGIPQYDGPIRRPSGQHRTAWLIRNNTDREPVREAPRPRARASIYVPEPQLQTAAGHCGQLARGGIKCKRCYPIGDLGSLRHRCGSANQTTNSITYKHLPRKRHPVSAAALRH
jgi:hypothetical protein